MTELILVQKCLIRQLLAEVERTCKEQENKEVVLVCEPTEIKVDALNQTQKKVNLLESALIREERSKKRDGSNKAKRAALHPQKHGFIKAQSAEEASMAVDALFDSWIEKKHQADDQAAVAQNLVQRFHAYAKDDLKKVLCELNVVCVFSYPTGPGEDDAASALSDCADSYGISI